ncbi:MAG: ABC transporter substrate-binding protein [Tissierellia bacterium]|nr:ABC transporter substrate-binding protein [Tissierellia bacterium]
MNFKKSVYESCEEHKKLREFLISKGFDNLKDEDQYRMMAPMINLEDALHMRQIDSAIFEEEFRQYNGYHLEEEAPNEKGDVLVSGAVPCPIKVPLIEALKDFSPKQKEDINFDLRSANLGMDFVTEKFKRDEILPDLITSAGYELVLDEDIYREIERSYVAPTQQIGKEFKERGVDLVDPNGKLHIFSIVPAVFIVNKDLLKGREMPKSWEELLSGEFKNSLSIPVSDLDMYNALVLTIYAHFGLDGIKKLRECFHSNLHPAQMVKTRNKPACVSIAPYFFASMIQSPSLVQIWPKEGAIVSPIFMTAKKDRLAQVQPAIDYFLSDSVSEIFSFHGKFPCTREGIDNHLSPEQKFLFAGWDLLNNRRREVQDMVKEYFKL